MDWKFWNKDEKTDVLESSVSADLSKDETCIFHAGYSNLDIRRAILDWRDKQIENVELHLIRELPRLYSALDEQIDKMSIGDLFSPGRFGKEYLEPIYKDWVEQEVGFLVEAAQKDLLAVFTHVLEFNEQGTVLDHEERSVHYTDVVVSAAATAAGLATVPAVLASSVVSAGGVMGLLGATVIAWPAVAIGTIVIVGLLGLGFYKAGDIKLLAISRYREGVREAIEDQVLGSDSEKDSILQRLQTHLDKTAEGIILEIDKC